MSHLALTIGDPTGIGPEITAKVLQRTELFPHTRITVVGQLDSLMQTASNLGLVLPQNEHIAYQDIVAEKPGNAAYQAVEKAVQLIAAGQADALVTGPISKKNLHDAEHHYPGHTEILEHLTHKYFNTPDARAEMLFAYKKFRLLLLTRHLPLKDVPAAISQTGAVARPIKTLIRFLRHQAGVDEPTIALLGLNPHAGEIGDEEKKYLMPVLYAVNGIGASKLEGCFAADAFFRSFNPETTKYDAVVATYHDQGLIPFKMLAGYEAVNITIGLPFIRTSVSHGTAEDIAGQGTARDDSLLAAIQSAKELLNKKA